MRNTYKKQVATDEKKYTRSRIFYRRRHEKDDDIIPSQSLETRWSKVTTRSLPLGTRAGG